MVNPKQNRRFAWREANRDKRARLDVCLPRVLLDEVKQEAARLKISTAGFVAAALREALVDPASAASGLHVVERTYRVRFAHRPTRIAVLKAATKSS